MMAPAMRFDQSFQSLRSCLGRFATGVVVVTFESADGPRGITVNSFTSVSMNPPLVLVSVARAASAHDRLFGCSFCVNVLSADQEGLARQFAGSGDFDVTWARHEGPPRLAGVLAHLGCRPWRTYDGGDHTLFIGEVVDYDYRDGDALAFHGSQYTRIVDDQLGIEYLL
jgi:flavin reductase